MNKLIKSQNGLTLPSLIVPIMTLGILVGLVVPRLVQSKENTNIQTAVNEIKTIETAMNMYKLENNLYPTTEQGLEALVNQTDIEPIPRTFPDEGYLSEMPLDPWHNYYLLVSPGDIGTIDIFSMGPDGIADTDDDIGNWSSGNH